MVEVRTNRPNEILFLESLSTRLNSAKKEADEGKGKNRRKRKLRQLLESRTFGQGKQRNIKKCHGPTDKPTQKNCLVGATENMAVKKNVIGKKIYARINYQEYYLEHMGHNRAERELKGGKIREEEHGRLPTILSSCF